MKPTISGPRRPRGLTRTLAVMAAAGALLTVSATAKAATVPTPAPGQAAGAASWGGGAVTPHVDLFYQATNQRLVQKGPSGDTDLGGVLTSGPAAIAKSPTEFVDESVYARGADNAIWARQYSDGLGQWLGWTSLGGRARGAPGVTCVGDGVAAPIVYVRGTDGALWRRQLPGGWTSLGGQLISDPAGLAARGGACPADEHAFAVGTDRAVWERTPAGWRLVGGRSTVAPAAIVLASGETDLFVRGTDGALWMNSRTTGSAPWDGWRRVGGQLTSGVTAVVDLTAPITRVVVALGSDGSLWQGRNVVGTTTWAWAQVP